MAFCTTHNREFKGPNTVGNYWHVTTKNAKGEWEYCSESADLIEKKPEYTPKMEKTAEEIRNSLRDYDAENRGKVRTNLLKALVQFRGLEPLTIEEKGVLNSMTDFAMEGK